MPPAFRHPIPQSLASMRQPAAGMTARRVLDDALPLLPRPESEGEPMSTVFHPVDRIDYPDSDGQPMAESDFQRTPLIYAVESLRIYFQDRADVYVSGNLFLYYEPGNPRAVVAPDVFVVIGAPRHDRASYKLWEEPKGPDFVLEITSRSTYTEDQGVKRGVYALLGVREYWQYDPTGDFWSRSCKAGN